MTPEILVGNAVADALAKKGESVFPAVNDWRKMDQITSAVQQRFYASSILAAQAAPRNASAHPEDTLITARRIRKRERTNLENASTCANILLPQGVVRWIGFETPSAQDRPALILPILCASAIRFFMSRIG